MNIILLEDARAPIFSEDLRAKTPRSSIIRMEPKNTRTCISLMKGKPTLTSTWLVFVDMKVSDIVLESISGLPNCINIVFTKSVDAERKLSICRKGGDSKLLDMINVDKESCVSYITSRLNTSEKLSKSIADKCNYFLPYIEEAILVLEMIDKEVTKSDVDLYIQKRSNLTVNSLFYHLVGFKTLSSQIVSDFLYQYKFAFPYIKKKLLLLFSESEKIYKSIENGNLGLDNIKDYLKNNKVKISEYMISVLISKIHPIIGLGELVLIKISIDKIDDMVNLLSLF